MTENALDLEALEKLCEEATPGPWVFNGYSALIAAEKVVAEEAFWDERIPDSHTYEAHVGETCPACGDRPALLPDGTRHGTYWGCAKAGEAIDADSTVATVRPSYGDTATGQRIHDAEFIAAARSALPTLIARVRELEAAQTWEYGWRVSDQPPHDYVNQDTGQPGPAWSRVRRRSAGPWEPVGGKNANE